MQDVSFSQSDAVTDKVEVNFDVLRSLMLNRVGGHVGSADVVAIDDSCSLDWLVQLRQELAKPHRFSATVHNRAIRRFGA
jgi:hypothetical protein